MSEDDGTGLVPEAEEGDRAPVHVEDDPDEDQPRERVPIVRLTPEEEELQDKAIKAMLQAEQRKVQRFDPTHTRFSRCRMDSMVRSDEDVEVGKFLVATNCDEDDHRSLVKMVMRMMRMIIDDH